MLTVASNRNRALLFGGIRLTGDEWKIFDSALFSQGEYVGQRITTKGLVEIMICTGNYLSVYVFMYLFIHLFIYLFISLFIIYY